MMILLMMILPIMMLLMHRDHWIKSDGASIHNSDDVLDVPVHDVHDVPVLDLGWMEGVVFCGSSARSKVEDRQIISFQWSLHFVNKKKAVHPQIKTWGITQQVESALSFTFLDSAMFSNF